MVKLQKFQHNKYILIRMFGFQPPYYCKHCQEYMSLEQINLLTPNGIYCHTCSMPLLELAKSTYQEDPISAFKKEMLY